VTFQYQHFTVSNNPLGSLVNVGAAAGAVLGGGV
jgi:hypothetical protein